MTEDEIPLPPEPPTEFGDDFGDEIADATGADTDFDSVPATFENDHDIGDDRPAHPAHALSDVLDELVDKAVRKRLSVEADAIAAAKFEEVVTPELHAALTAAAEARIAAAIAVELAQAQQAERAAKGPYYRNCYHFFTEFLAPMYRRRVIDSSTFHWCPEWRKHGEATSRIDSLWRTWEHLRLDPTTGVSVWWRDHADHHMAHLLSPEGTFRDCSPTKGHKALVPLPYDSIPGILYDSVPGDPPVAGSGTTTPHSTTDPTRN